MSRKEHLLALLAVVVLAALLRLTGLGRSPDGFWMDEAAICVNARSIVATGRDQYGEPWPFFFRAMDDYKAPFYVYGVAAWSLVAGDDVTAARLKWGDVGNGGFHGHRRQLAGRFHLKWFSGGDVEIGNIAKRFQHRG